MNLWQCLVDWFESRDDLRKINADQAATIRALREITTANTRSIQTIARQRDEYRDALVSAEAAVLTAEAAYDELRAKYDARRGHPSTWTQEGDT